MADWDVESRARRLGLFGLGWQDVCRTLDLDLKGQTSASYNMRLNYEKTLLEFENYLSSGQYDADVVRGEHTRFEVFLAF